MRNKYILIAILGLVHALSFAPFPIPAWALQFLQLFTLSTLFFQILKANKTRTAVFYSLIFGISNYTLGLYWLFISMNTYGGMIWPLAALAVVLLAAYLSIYMALATAAVLFLCKKSILAIQSWQKMLVASLVWASAWTMAEWLRGTLLTGFPWLNIGYAHVDGILAPWASIVGTYGITWISSFLAIAIASLTLHHDNKHNSIASPSLGIGILFTVVAIGLSHIHWVKPNGDTMYIRLTQGNIEQSEKFDPLLIQNGIDQYQNLANLDVLENTQLDLIVLPETVLPIFSDHIGAELWQQWIDISKKQNAHILLGAPLRDAKTRISTNSAIAFDKDTSSIDLAKNNFDNRYDKHHLVPFGEFIPQGFQWFVEKMHIPMGGFNHGDLVQQPFNINDQNIAPNICYEDLFGEEIINQVNNVDNSANILINISNLAWFGDTWALRQHLQISRMRAMETARPMLRSTNTGMTAIIDPNGVVRAALETNTPGVLDVEVQGMQGLTPYARVGNKPVLIWSLLLLFMGFIVLRRN